MNKLEMQTPNFTDENIEKLAGIFPNCVTESKDDSGRLKKAIDFDLLKQELSENIVDGPRERYQINWPGKKEALVSANTPINKTFRPCREESVDFDTTENLYIEGDNLEALKLLQESYLGKVKMIYIDPPYNTGKDFVYKDNYTRSIEAELEASDQVNLEGGRLVANVDSNGRFHSDWLSMIYSRLRLARNLLTDDGVMFISIDDNEIANLRKICNDIFNETCVEEYVWDVREDGTMPKTAKNTVRKEHEYLLAVFKNKKKLEKYISYKYIDNDWSNADDDPRGPWMSANISRGSGTGTGGSKSFIITNPKGVEFDRNWSISEEEYSVLLNDNRIYFADNGNGVPRKKIFKNEPVSSIQSSIFEKLNSSQSASSNLQKLIGNIEFDYPKPTELIHRIIQIASNSNDYILDFFSGTSTTAEAVIQLNSENNKNRKFIMVQLPEITDEKSKAFNSGYKNICEIGKERIRRAGKKIKEENADKEGIEDLDIGFRVLKIDSSNMKDVYYAPDQMSQSLLDSQQQNIKEDRTAEDLLFQVLLDWGVDLTLSIKREEIHGKTVYFVDEDTLVACFDDGLDAEFAKEIAARKPLRAVFKENGYKQDEDKINIDQVILQFSPDTEVRAI